MASSSLSAFIFNLGLQRLQALLVKPDLRISKSNLLVYMEILIWVVANGFYLVKMKEAISLTVHTGTSSSLWFAIYACLFNVLFCATKITKTHFANTTFDLQPSNAASIPFSEATEERRLVPIYRVSYIMTPLRRLLNFLRPVWSFIRPFKIYFQRCMDFIHSTCSYYRPQSLNYPTTSVFPGLNTTQYVEWLVFIVNALDLYRGGPRSKIMALIIVILLGRKYGSDHTHIWPFFRSLFYHDALVAHGKVYEVRSNFKKRLTELVRLEPRCEEFEKTSLMQYNISEEFLGYTYYTPVEIKAKADHLVRVMPGFDYLSYNCQAFVQNLFRRIVAHEFCAKELTTQPRHRTLHGYHDQRSNTLGISVIILMFSSETVFTLLSPLRYNWLCEHLVFCTCTWHGKPASNRVALVQFLACYTVFYMLDIDFTRLISAFTDSYERVASSYSEWALLSFMVLFVVNGVVKMFHWQVHMDQQLPKLAWGFYSKYGHDGMKVKVCYFKPNSNQPLSGYKVTNSGLIPVVTEERTVVDS